MRQSQPQIKSQTINNRLNPTVVQFANLDDNNKTQFLQFLLRNNITFERSVGKNKDDYIAKVMVQKPQAGTNKQNKNIQSAKNKGKNINTTVSKLKQKNNINVSSNKIDKTMKVTTPRKQNLKTINTSLIKDGASTPIQKQKSKLKDTIQALNQSSKPMKVTNKSSYRQLEKNSNNQNHNPVRTSEFLANQKSQRASIKNINQKQRVISKKQLQKQTPKSRNRPKIEKFQQQSQRQIRKQKNGQQKQKETIQKAKSNNKSLPSLKKTIVEKQKAVQINHQLKKKTEEQKEICELVNKYFKLFEIKLQGQRPIKWSYSQLIKTIQQIYNQLFVKNTQSLSQKGLVQKDGLGNNLIRFIKQYLMNKFKNEKLANTNLINMLYSLSFYLQNEKKYVINSKSYAKQVKSKQLLTASGIFVQSFQDFICQIYQYEDLLFYLFIRNIINKNQPNLVNTTKNKLDKQINKAIITDRQLMLPYKDIIKLLALILGQDLQLIQQYKIMIISHISSSNHHQQTQDKHSQAQNKNQLKISCSGFMALLVEDYKNKRLLMQKSIVKQKKEQKKGIVTYGSILSQRSENTFEDALQTLNSNNRRQQLFDKPDIYGHMPNLNQHQADQLTFGQETQSNFQNYFENKSGGQICKQFWESKDQLRVFASLQQDCLESIIYEKMKKKVKEFINILIQNKSQYNSIQSRKVQNKQNFTTLQKNCVMEIFMKKSLSLLACLFQMNKLKWFEQLKVNDPSQQDIDKVQQLQLMYRKLKIHPDAESIGRLCKSILTVCQLTLALEKLIYQ